MEWQEDYPGLFSKNSTWPRASEYELLEKGGRLYVVPTKGAVIEYYKPFEHYLDILEAFFKMAKTLKEINNEFNEWSKRLTDEPNKSEFIDKMKKRYQKEGRAIIQFAKRYGLLGVFFECFHDIYNDPVYYPDEPYFRNEWENRVMMTHRGVSIIRDSLYADPKIQNHTTVYEHFARVFFPRLHSSYPIPPGYQSDINGSSKKFWNEYGERVDWILSLSSWLHRDFVYWNEWIAAEKSGKTLDDSPDPNSPNYTWYHKLNFVVHPVGLAMEYNPRGKGTWQQRYIFNSLLMAIKIMHLRDRVATFSQIRICDWCGDIYQTTKSTSRWCGSSCANLHGVTKNRKKNVINQMMKDGIPVNEIAEKMNVDQKWVIEWAKEAANNEESGR